MNKQLSNIFDAVMILPVNENGFVPDIHDLIEVRKRILAEIVELHTRMSEIWADIENLEETDLLSDD